MPTKPSGISVSAERPGGSSRQSQFSADSPELPVSGAGLVRQKWGVSALLRESPWQNVMTIKGTPACGRPAEWDREDHMRLFVVLAGREYSSKDPK